VAPTERRRAPVVDPAERASDAPAVALVHDYLNQYGGAERVLLALHRLFPAAPVFTSIYDRERMPAAFRALDIRTSFMQRLPGVLRRHQLYLPCYPLAFEGFDLTGYDLVVSSSSAWAKGVITPPATPHICYCHAPMRFAWSYHAYVERERIGGPARRLLPLVMVALRLWDVAATARVDRFVANSRAVAARIAKYYRREATVIHPPVETGRFFIAPEVDDYYLIVQRLVPYKRLDLVIEAFNALRLPLKIVGGGRARADLERMAGPTIEFAGRLSDEELGRAYARCRAYIVPGEEDFAIAPVEAQAAGRPVVAFGAGGALETVVEGQTGVFFRQPTAAALAAAVRGLQAMPVRPELIRAHALTFDTAVFERRMRALIDEVRHDQAGR
jgi:glycosyltransferase involved in cell wall biosynthesis